MRFPSLLLPLCAIALGLLVPASAEEKNGLQVSVQKVTLDRADFRGNDVNIENLDRTMGLRVSLRNTTFKEIVNGEVTWEIVKRKWDNAALELTTGTEKLPRLRAGESVEITIGAARTSGQINGASLRKDELEWELTFKQGAREIARFSSKSNFQTLLKRASLMPTPEIPGAAAAAPPAPAPSAAPVAPAAAAPAAPPAPGPATPAAPVAPAPPAPPK